MNVLTNEQKQQIITNYLKTAKGHKKLAMAIARPLIQRMNYSRRILQWEETISLPTEWLVEVQKILHKNTKIYKEMRIGITLFNRKQAIEICKCYLKIMDTTQWPLLIGQHPVMDQVLGQALKGDNNG